ncbi:Galactosamine-6-phosphate isomerase [Pantoea sp. AS-PWVM4]|uniref:SIS domain-containing protein n=1 Tax=Pantoea sp. AS-PWVM4 TaxID=1332069 RepID=UPI0003AC952D|nr:SIS domain-containing protein [Pantoea sp. AS-PWVM4]ERK17635.1 Galactosamine-6-phosphate isomerase [Pantoea sp. AS-PWVM4]
MNETLAANTSGTQTWTEEEIRQQPTSWMTALHHLDTQRAELDDWLNTFYAQPGGKIILTGAGSSAFIGDIIAPCLARQLQANVVAIPTTDLVTNPMDYFHAEQPLLLVSFARSGNSPESVAAVQLANQFVANCRHLIITCNATGDLYHYACEHDNARVRLMPAETHDRGFAMTSSISTMMLSCLAIFAPQLFNSHSFASVAACCEAIIASHGDFSQSAFGDLNWRRVVYLGSGGLQGAARESALKVLELTAGQLAAFYESPVGFRHGPKSLVDDETLVVVFVSSHPYTRQYDLDLLAELHRENIALRVVAISDTPATVMEAGPHLYLPASRTFNDIELAFCFLVYAQIFALTASLKAGITPDTPSASGTVNRVVQGVVIHSWPEVR